MLSQFYQKLWSEAYRQNDTNIIKLLESNPEAKALDIGCGDGQKTTLFKKKINCKEIIGVDGVAQRLVAAKKLGVKTKLANLEKKLPMESESFDVVISNQVIEHLVDLDHFIKEIDRVLKPGGYCIISTENLASWHNIFALVLGHQDFSHHLISKTHVGNPLSPHFEKKTASWSAPANSGVDDAAFPHIKILTYKSLRKVFEAYGFRFEKGLTSGYYPFFGVLGQAFSRIDPFHSHFIAVKMRKSAA